jgi:hypothetical protein
MATYESIEPVGREEAEAAFQSGDPSEVVRALLGLALHDPDLEWVQSQCFRLASHPDVWVRRNVATSLGHLARIHRRLDVERVTSLLDQLASDPEVAGWVEDAWDDLHMFIPSRQWSVSA